MHAMFKNHRSGWFLRTFPTKAQSLWVYMENTQRPNLIFRYCDSRCVAKGMYSSVGIQEDRVEIRGLPREASLHHIKCVLCVWGGELCISREVPIESQLSWGLGPIARNKLQKELLKDRVILRNEYGLWSQTNLGLNSSFPKHGNFTDLKFSSPTRKTRITRSFYLTGTL